MAKLDGSITALTSTTAIVVPEILPAPAVRTEPEPVAPDPELVALRAQLEDQKQRAAVLEGTLTRLAREPQRRGTHSNGHAPAVGAQGFFSTLVTRSKEQGYEAIASVFDDKLQKQLSGDDEAKYSMASIHNNLFAVLAAAEADMLLLSPEERAHARWQ